MQAVAYTKLALLDDEPAGLIPTLTPGSVSFDAKLSWQRPQDVFQGELVPAMPEGVRLDLVSSQGADAESNIAGEIRAFSEDRLEEALDSILRRLISAAASSEAILEVSSVSNERPGIVPRGVLELLAIDARRAGFAVRFGACWATLPDGAEAAIGVRGAEDAYERLSGLSSWEITSRDL